MQRLSWCLCTGLLFAAAGLAQNATPTRALTWQETEALFKANNPTLLAGKVNIDEARAEEITAYLRPNPNLNLSLDQLGLFSYSPFQPTANALLSGSVDYLHERQHKRELRLQSARQATGIAISSQGDLERNLIFSLRDAFVRVLLAKAVRRVAQENIEYYDKQIELNRTRYEAGDMAKVAFQRVELQRVQYESDLATSQVNLRTAKIDLLQFLRDRTPVDQFDVDEPFDFGNPLTPMEELRAAAIEARPDLRQAEQSLGKARADHQLALANGTADPIFGVNLGRQPPQTFYAGLSLSIPLRIFDKNQGEKLRTQLEIGRTQKLRDAAEVGVMRDVESAYASMQNTLTLLRPYRSKYLQEAEDIRSTVSFAYLHGAASLLDFLDAQKQYRDTQVNFLNLVGAYLSSANQVNLAVGREVIR